MDGDCSEYVHMDSGLPQGTVSGSLMFLLYANDTGNKTSSNINLFVDDCLLFHPITSLKVAQALQDDLDCLVK